MCTCMHLRACVFVRVFACVYTGESDNGFIPTSALLKGILMHSGREVRYDHNTMGKYLKDNHLPNYAQGFGSVDLESVLGLGGSDRTAGMACSGTYDRYQCGAVGCCAWSIEHDPPTCVSAVQDASTPCASLSGGSGPGTLPSVDVTMRVEQNDAVGTGDVHEYCVELSDASVGGDVIVAPLRATLAYTDAPGSPWAETAIVNDLDLTVVGPSGKWAYGNNLTSSDETYQLRVRRDTVNNVEQIRWPHFDAGRYLVKVRGHDVPDGRGPGFDQRFALVLSGAGLTVKSLEECSSLGSECPEDCNQVGNCVAGACHCSPFYSGPACEFENVVLSPGMEHSVSVSEYGWSYYVWSGDATWTMDFSGVNPGLNVLLAFERLPSTSDYDLALRYDNFEQGCLDARTVFLPQTGGWQEEKQDEVEFDPLQAIPQRRELNQANLWSHSGGMGGMGSYDEEPDWGPGSGWGSGSGFTGTWVLAVGGGDAKAELKLTLDGCEGSTMIHPDCFPCPENMYGDGFWCGCATCPPNSHSTSNSLGQENCVCDAGFNYVVSGDPVCVPACNKNEFGLKASGGMSCSGCGCASVQKMLPGTDILISVSLPTP